MLKLSLILLSALVIGNTFGAPVQITSLPFAIVAPGTYVVTGNLSSSETQNIAAITISTALSGPVILDLSGFTLTGNAGASVGIGIGIFAGTSAPNAYPITIRNGTLTNFAFGVWADVNGGITSDITISNLAINIGASGPVSPAGVLFSSVQNSTISNCSFQDGSNGIEDALSPGGNRYLNCTFKNTNPLFVTSQNGGVPSRLDRCVFAAPLRQP